MSAQEEVLPWWGRPKGQRHCPLFHAHCSCPLDVCQRRACFWVGVCRGAKIVFRKWKTNGLCLFSITAVQVMAWRLPKLVFFCFFLTHSLHLKGVSFNSVVADQSLTVVPLRECRDDLTTAASGLPVPAAAGFSICGESVSCKSARVKAGPLKGALMKATVLVWGYHSAHTHTHLQTHSLTHTKQCVEIFVRRDHAHGDSDHGDYIHDRVQVKQSRERLQFGWR